jgi:hypothetical protein
MTLPTRTGGDGACGPAGALRAGTGSSGARAEGDDSLPEPLSTYVPERYRQTTE